MCVWGGGAEVLKETNSTDMAGDVVEGTDRAVRRGEVRRTSLRAHDGIARGALGTAHPLQLLHTTPQGSPRLPGTLSALEGAALRLVMDRMGYLRSNSTRWDMRWSGLRRTTVNTGTSLLATRMRPLEGHTSIEFHVWGGKRGGGERGQTAMNEERSHVPSMATPSMATRRCSTFNLTPHKKTIRGNNQAPIATARARRHD